MFEQASASFEILTTRAISPQILRHKTANFQELSQRYSNPWEVLEELEKPGREGKRSGKGRARNSNPAMQMPLFNPEQPLVEDMLSLDVPNLTPIEAITKLYELQERARKLAERE